MLSLGGQLASKTHCKGSTLKTGLYLQ